MDITFTPVRDHTVCTLSGRLDAVTTIDFDDRWQVLFDEGRRFFVLDMTDLNYISSAGLRSVLAMAKHLRAYNGALALYGLTGLVREMISMTGIDAAVKVYKTAEEAVGASE